VLVVAGVGRWKDFGGGGELVTAADGTAGFWCSLWVWRVGDKVAVADV